MTDNTNKNLIERPPVVVIMGHIDHGKSTLLDFIRQSNIVSREAGGITQHLGAYEVIRKSDTGEERKITFLDTPGHEAFGSVRARGSQVADIAILIISAEDGVKPQTLEALQAIKKYNVPFMVAINKIDSPKADVGLVKQNLVENEVYVEGYGGDIPVVEISAKTGQNIPELLDMISLVAEISELKGDPNETATGFVVESSKDKQKGVSATLVIKNGSIKQGQFVVCQNAMAPIRSIIDCNGKTIKEATFSAPVNIMGWSDIPKVGAEFKIFNDKNEAASYSASFTKKSADEDHFGDKKGIALPLIIKADSQGSVDAIIHELKKVPLEEAYIKVISKDIGNISETDIKMAAGSEKTFVVGFGVKIDKPAEIMADKFEVEVKTFKIIYELIDWLKEAIEKRRPRIQTEELIGEAKIIKVFNAVKSHQILGAKVREGVIKLGSKIKILRREEEIGSGVIKELQQQKNKTSEVSEGNECGMGIDSKIEIAPGDSIKAIQIVEK